MKNRIKIVVYTFSYVVLTFIVFTIPLYKWESNLFMYCLCLALATFWTMLSGAILGLVLFIIAAK